MQDGSFSHFACNYFYELKQHCASSILKKTCLDTYLATLNLFRYVLKIMFRGLEIALPHSFNIGILIIRPLVLFESWLLIIWRMSVLEKSQEIKVCSVSNFNLDGNMLLFGIIEHWLQKKFDSLKIVTYLLLWKIGGMHGIFSILVMSLAVTSSTLLWSVVHTNFG